VRLAGHFQPGTGLIDRGDRRLLRRFKPEKSARISDAFRPAFFRFYLGGPALALAYVYNYLALGLFIGGWLFLMVNAFV
jgi:hypothetical protein